MKMSWVAHLTVLLIGSAIPSTIVLAQDTPVAALPSDDRPAAVVPEAVVPSTDSGAVHPSSRPYYQSPILAYTRPTEKQKVDLFIFDAFGPYAIAKAALGGGIDQAHNAPPEWGGGAKPFAERVGSNFGIDLVTTATDYGFAELLREDAAYYPCECRGFLPRMRHAVISTVTARRGTDGHTVFSFPGLVSPYAGSMTALAWYPERYGVKDGFRLGNYNIAVIALENLALEFLYGGPHSMFSHVASFKTPGGPAPDQNP